MFALHRPTRHLSIHLALILTIIAATLASLSATPARAFSVNPAAVFINEIHYDNTGTDTGEAIEIVGPAGTDLTGWSIVRYNGSNPANGVVYTTPIATETLSGALPNLGSGFGVIVVIYPTDGIQNGGNDAIALVNSSSQVVQFLSYEGVQVAGNGPAVGLTSTDIGVTEIATTPVGFSLQLGGNGTTYQSFSWQSQAANTFGAINTNQSFVAADAAPSVVAVVPVNGSADVPASSTIAVTFSEPVTAGANAFSLVCDTSSVALGVSGGPTTFILTPASALGTSAVCTLTVTAAEIADQDGSDPPDTMAANFSSSFTVAGPACITPFTPISQIQGAGSTAAVTGLVTTQGLVIADYEGGASPEMRGFYIQDPAGDGDPATSDAIFVFSGTNANLVSLGQVVRVTGTASDFQDQTQLSGTLTIVDCGLIASVDPVAVALPVPAPVAGVSYLERFEGMLVSLPQTLYVTEHFQLGRFGQVTLSSGGVLRTPTHLAAPGAAAIAQQNANLLNKIILDDTRQNQNPDPIVFGRGGNPLSATNTLRGGDTVAGIVGVMTYTWAGNGASGNAFRVRPTAPVTFVAANERPAAPTNVGGRIKVATSNLLNYFNTFNDGNAATPGCFPRGIDGDCRGAESQLEFDRQSAKTVAMVGGLDADIIGLVELENDGYGPSSAIQDLLNRLNSGAAPEDQYALIDLDAATGQVNAAGTDAIKVALIYRPASVQPVGSAAVLNTGAFGLFTLANGTTTGRSRPAVAATFEDIGGARITVVVNHLKSKGSACADNASPVGPDVDTGDGQGNCNLTRLAAAQELVTWLAANPTGAGDGDTLIIGDLNSYAQEDPITAIRSAGYTDLIGQFLGGDAYSYLFDGQFGYLDHALATNGLAAQVTGVAEWHVNADEPTVLDYNTNFKTAGQIASLFSADQYRASDHDPLLVGLNLTAPIPVTTASASGTAHPSCPADCFSGSAMVTLTTDRPVATTEYRINGGSWQTYSAPFTITNEGRNLVEFFSTGRTGAIESVRSISVKVTTFPTAAILDSFNRANGGLGGNWILSATNAYMVSNKQAVAMSSTPALWRGSNASSSIYGARQEVAMTVTNPVGLHLSLLLKVQPNASGNANSYSVNNGYLAVAYDSTHKRVNVQSYTRAAGLQSLASFAITLQPGDVLGARALADGSVRVYVNCELIGVAQAPAFADKGGRVGVWFVAANGGRFDDFRGGDAIP